jgi:muramidase (phage lysozyme)
MTPNAQAFLSMIQISEGTAKAPNPYAVTFGEAFTIQDFSDHPHALGWPGFLWKGIHETASGAYQITYPTWVRMKAKLGLSDFSAFSQDAAALELIREAKALEAVNGGRVTDAIAACSGIWASLPGSTSRQPQTKLGTLVQAYSAAGGGFA